VTPSTAARQTTPLCDAWLDPNRRTPIRQGSTRIADEQRSRYESGYVVYAASQSVTVLFVVGRVFYALAFAMPPFATVRQARQVASAPQLRKLPVPALLITVTCVVGMAGATSIAFGIWPDVGVILTAGFLVPVTLVMHPFWSVPPERRQQERSQFLLNLSMLGGGLVLFSFVNQTQHVPGGLVASPLLARW
jgi:putative oxidoreductase